MKLIPLTKGYSAEVDDEDYDRLAAFRWHVALTGRRNQRPYARRAVWVDGKSRSIAMHREILGFGGFIDHRDGNGLNNQRSNLRRCTRSDNMANSAPRLHRASQWKGVTRNTNKGRAEWPWRARIAKNGTGFHLGHFRQEYNAATAYNFAAEEVFGEFAVYNLPEPR